MRELSSRQLKIVEYLSGEMSDEQLISFESEMEKDDGLKAEVDQLKRTSMRLDDWPDETVSVPSLQEISPGTSKVFQLKELVIPSWAKVAAALFVLPLMLWLLNLQLSIENNAVTLSFGPTQTHNIEEPVQHKAFHDEDSQGELANLSKLSDSLANKQKEMLDQWANEYSDNIEKLLKRHESNQIDKVEDMIARLEDQNSEELAQMFTSILNSLETQRQEDLGKIELAFLQIADALNRQQFETEELLANIFYNSPIKNN